MSVAGNVFEFLSVAPATICQAVGLYPVNLFFHCPVSENGQLKLSLRRQRTSEVQCFAFLARFASTVWQARPDAVGVCVWYSGSMRSLVFREWRLSVDPNMFAFAKASKEFLVSVEWFRSERPTQLRRPLATAL